MGIIPLKKQHHESPESSRGERCELDSKSLLCRLIRDNAFSVHFQPIVSSETQDIYAYEGLCRTVGINPFSTLDNLFEQARLCGEICRLDMLCRENTIRQAAAQSIVEKNARLFINVCPTVMQQKDHSPGETVRLVSSWGLDKEQVVLEITEQEAVSNYPLFLRAVNHYRDCGFKIAIDDFGAGYGGMKMLSLITPDYVKIDRHFFRDEDSAHINYSLIDAVATICHRIGIDVIGEGIESEKEVEICREFGISLMQGYYFAKPAPRFIDRPQIRFPDSWKRDRSAMKVEYDEAICIEDIVSYSEPASSDDKVLQILDRFSHDPQLICLPILKGDKVCGLLNRHRFMEKHMVGRYGYGKDLNYYKKVKDIIDDEYLQVPHYMPIEEVAQKINLRRNLSMYDDICVTRSGKYIGTVAVSSILSAVTNKSLLHARGANPLTGLPGNEFIQREIVKMLSQSVHFDICYIDIDNFKPYNDKHGFALGDEVIKELGDIIRRASIKFSVNGIGFGGHIGGDDFILITRPRQSIASSHYVIDRFKGKLPLFHTRESLSKGCYESTDRQGQILEFPLLSLSIGIVSTEVHHISSVAQASSISSDLKKRAKAVEGNSIIRDRRIQSWFENSEGSDQKTLKLIS